ncbi:succinate CoA transferase [Sesbania bispinosa]|nr:succinate CoA transferase [Sesbania bispinosa]
MQFKPRANAKHIVDLVADVAIAIAESNSRKGRNDCIKVALEQHHSANSIKQIAQLESFIVDLVVDVAIAIAEDGNEVKNPGEGNEERANVGARDVVKVINDL